MAFDNLVKRALIRVGRHLQATSIRRLDTAISYLEVSRWLKERGFDRPQTFAKRAELFDHLAQDVGRSRLLYLEFGVFQGTTIRYWSEIVRDPRATFVGFDSFRGLPESWRDLRRGHFDTHGAAPKIDDERVSFVTGWIEETLPTFVPVEHDVLVVNIDADLYSSASAVLSWAQDWLKPGSYLHFDEFYDRHHELRAFNEHLEETGFRYRLVGATSLLNHVAFQRVG